MDEPTISKVETINGMLVAHCSDGRVFTPSYEYGAADGDECYVCQANGTGLCSIPIQGGTPCNKSEGFIWVEIDPLYADLLKVKELL